MVVDYRRVNAVTELDAGGLGTQSDILYGIGGKFKFLGLMDAAGGFYQYLLSPRARKRSGRAPRPSATALRRQRPPRRCCPRVAS